MNKLKTNLEKISYKQNRNYEEEAIKQQQSKDQQPIIVDKQTVSFNFNKANEFPNLYKGNFDINIYRQVQGMYGDDYYHDKIYCDVITPDY